jgi:hypothetical protein
MLLLDSQRQATYAGGRSIEGLVAHAQRLPTARQQDLIIALVSRLGETDKGAEGAGQPRTARETGSLVLLDRVYAEASVPNWDGYGATPVSRLAYERAKSLIRLLPGDAPPDLGADPEGDVLLEWRRGPGAVLTISIGAGEQLAYAGLFGQNKVHGSEFFNDEIPNAVRQVLARVLSGPAG